MTHAMVIFWTTTKNNVETIEIEDMYQTLFSFKAQNDGIFPIYF